MLNIKIQYVHPASKTPRQGSDQAAGWDVFSPENIIVPGGRRKRIPLGFSLELPVGWCARLKQRSSMFEKGLITNDSPIDSDFRGEICVLVANLGEWPWHVSVGDRIAQLVFEHVPVVRFVAVDELSVTKRGTGGFGSSGR